ncbi:unnamed protein product [Prorocentrum cordatum]|uniref:RRM domain-containing protein n=1 Tax=Prorocentrum cordatum TaxID=2364126 RepID=A0ABN9X4T5_9DINO|nr:unnamed protein product [Polarella glacialis]
MADVTELTLIVGNLPKSLNRDQIMDWLNDLGYGESYDFLYVPRCFKTNTNKGYMFINFMQKVIGFRFAGALHGAATGSGSSRFVVSLSETQGIERSLAKLRKSSSRRIKNPQAQAYVRHSVDPESSTAPRGGPKPSTGPAQDPNVCACAPGPRPAAGGTAAWGRPVPRHSARAAPAAACAFGLGGAPRPGAATAPRAGPAGLFGGRRGEARPAGAGCFGAPAAEHRLAPPAVAELELGGDPGRGTAVLRLSL